MGWITVNSKASKRWTAKLSSAKQGFHTEEEVQRFLKQYKTTPCQRMEQHDYRQCHGYHSSSDQRRNPYREHYLLEECCNGTEKMYHPSIFRTGMCRSAYTCVFGLSCAHAHSPEQLRDRASVEMAYEQESFQPVLPPKTLADTVDPLLNQNYRNVSSQDYDALAQSVWQEVALVPSTTTVCLSEQEWFLINRSNSLFKDIQTAALEQGLGIVKKKSTMLEGKHVQVPTMVSTGDLVITAIDPGAVEASIRSLLVEPSNHFVTTSLQYSERVIDELRNSKMSLFSRDALVQFLDQSTVQLTAVHGKDGPAQVQLNRITEKVEFWVQQEGYDEMHECGCCYDSFNADQGILCSNGHFFCAVGGSKEDKSDQCFATMVTSQLNQLQSRKTEDGSCPVLCPECQVPYDRKSVAANLPDTVFKELEKAIVDAKVSQQVETWDERFNERVQAAVRDVLATYGNETARVKVEAQQLAQQARNTILNLSCPHCGIPYFEFTGCMALVCSTCNGSFCGYCHHKTPTSQGAHEHVRACLLNDTATGSYYANAEQIRDAQRKYRTLEIKKFLRGHKKNLQNAIVIELERELNDLDIRQEALFDLGNLMPNQAG